MPDQFSTSQVIRFATFEVDLQAQELRKGGLRLKLSGQPFQVLAILLEQPGVVVTREELQKRLWPDTFVDVDHNLNTAINKIREVLGDSAENPRFVETLPRRGYRFIAPLDNAENGVKRATIMSSDTAAPRRWRILGVALLFGALALLAGTGFLVYKGRRVPASPRQRTLTRLTFDEGLQFGPTWSPDGHYIAYSSDRGGKLDIWVQQVSGGDAVQVTKGPGHNWQPDWSPDGKYIAYRSERGDGGIYIVPALGGVGLERKIAAFGHHPRWSPDSAQILFDALFTPLVDSMHRFYVTRLDGSAPRELLAEVIARLDLLPTSAGWHPDGKRVSLFSWGPQGADSISSPRSRHPTYLWTVPLDGGVPVRSELALQVREELRRIGTSEGAEYEVGYRDFSWAPSGKTIYFDQDFRGARNIWRMTIDPATLRGTAIERLTFGPGPDSGVALSPDGKRIAFAAQSEHIGSMLFPFDPNTGQISGSGESVTSPGMLAFEESLSRDGTKLAFCAVRAGKWELWQRSLTDGREEPLIADDDQLTYPQWSSDGRRLVYTRSKASGSAITATSQILMWSAETRTEEPVTGTMDLGAIVYDLSPDDKELLVSRNSGQEHTGAGNRRSEVWRLSLGSAPHAETSARKLISDPAYHIWQPHFSPNGRWIVFEATRPVTEGVESTLYVMPSAGGQWTRITDGKQWDDKPRWSPDGRTIYFLSRRRGFFNVWGIHFDPEKGRPAGEPFRVSAFERPRLMVPHMISPVALSITKNRLLLTMSKVSGGIWVLDNVDR
jgi:Tol biopolymer transport system component/DNA-binding winged helix-turn-helix (wHTH) protein